MTWLSFALRIFFHLLYHSLAWTYDFVSATVSLGLWQDWISSVLPYIEGPSVLELGPGPGHLQEKLLRQGYVTIGLDESRQMVRQAQRRLTKSGYAKITLVSGLAQKLPFKESIFHNVVATFPSEYIFKSETLSECFRVLVPAGRLIVLPAAWITGQRLSERWAAGLFRVTSQAPTDPAETIAQRLEPLFKEAGFDFETELLEVKSSQLMLILARKPS